MRCSSQACTWAGSRRARSAFMGKSVCGRLIVDLYRFASDKTDSLRSMSAQRQIAARILGIPPHLGHQRVEIGEMFLIAQLGHELHLDLATIQIAIEIE